MKVFLNHQIMMVYFIGEINYIDIADVTTLLYNTVPNSAFFDFD